MSQKKVIPLTRKGGAASRPQPKAPSRAEVMALVNQARSLALQSPEKAAIVLTEWMNRAARSKKKAG